MYTTPVGINEVTQVLDGLSANGGKRPHLLFHYGDERLDWRAFDRCTDRGYPGLDHGQRGDCRWSLPGGRSLHAHWHDDRVEFHIDGEDPVKNPLGHLLMDTPAGALALLGGLGIGVATGSVGKALIGALGGVGLGLALDGGATTRWLLTTWRGAGVWEARRFARADSQVPA